MTREEQIKGLYVLKEYLTKNPIELDGHKSLPITLIDYAIEALEQEPIIDKISVEIERGKTGLDIEFNGGIDYALSIIDKYKAEQEK